MLRGVEAPCFGQAGLAPAIQGEDLVGHGGPTAVPGELEDHIRLVGQVGLFHLGHERGKEELVGLEVPLRPKLVLPDALLVHPVADHEVLVRVGREGLVEGLEGRGDPTLHPEVLVQVIVVREKLVPPSLHLDRALVGALEEPSGASLTGGAGGRVTGLDGLGLLFLVVLGGELEVPDGDLVGHILLALPGDREVDLHEDLAALRVCEALDDPLGALGDVPAVVLLGLVGHEPRHPADHRDRVAPLEGGTRGTRVALDPVEGPQVLEVDLRLRLLLFVPVALEDQAGLLGEVHLRVQVVQVLGPVGPEDLDLVCRELPEGLNSIILVITYYINIIIILI